MIRKEMDLKKLISIVRELRRLDCGTCGKRTTTSRTSSESCGNESDEMGSKEVKKWRNLQNVFRREHKKILAHKSGDGASLESSTWVFYKQMVLVVGTVVRRPILLTPRMCRRKIYKVRSLDQPSDLHIPDSPPPQMPPQTNVSTTQLWSEPGTRGRPKTLKRKRSEQSANEQLLDIEKEKLKLLAESWQMKRDSHYHYLAILLPIL